MNKEDNVIDIFTEEMSKKEKKLEKKMEKARLKEEKKKKKTDKQLENEENEGFKEYLEKWKSEKMIETPVKEVPIPVKKDSTENLLENIKMPEKKDSTENLLENTKLLKKRHPFLNFLIGMLSIILLVIGIDYVVYNTITNYVDIQTMINSILFIGMIIFYLLSIVIKKEVAKKSFQILSIIMMILFMSYQLFII
jgi:hypothetical protein